MLDTKPTGHTSLLLRSDIPLPLSHRNCESPVVISISKHLNPYIPSGNSADVKDLSGDDTERFIPEPDLDPGKE